MGEAGSHVRIGSSVMVCVWCVGGEGCGGVRV